jgi:hypothetical protein
MLKASIKGVKLLSFIIFYINIHKIVTNLNPNKKGKYIPV